MSSYRYYTHGHGNNGDDDGGNWDRQGSRGRGGWRGKRRGRGRGWGRESEEDFHMRQRQRHRDRQPSNPEDMSRGRGRGRPPPGLKGKEIGLWYRDQQSKKNKDYEAATRTNVHIDEQKERHLSSLLATIRAGDNCPAQPKQSYASPCDGDDRSASSPQTSKQSANSAVKHDWFDDESPDRSVDREEKRSYFEDRAGAGRASEMDGASNKPPSQSSSFIIDDPVDDMDSDEDDDDDDDNALNDVKNGSDSFMNSVKMEGDDVDDEEYVLDLEQYKQETEDSSFLFEFHAHKAANRGSTEHLHKMSSSRVGPVRDEALDHHLMNEHKRKLTDNSNFRKMLEFREKLPSYQMQQEIIDVVGREQVVVLSGETGCGKTTQVSQFLLDDAIQRGDGSLCRIICTQPRRISAISVAERVAEERGERCGEASVGYQIRLEHKKSRERGSILYCTTGILLKFLATDPLLARTSHVILDEIHERDILSDFLMIILRDLLPRRPDLKLILMSATLNADMFSEYFNNCPRLNIPGYTFPVREYLLEEIIDITRYCGNGRAPRKPRYGNRHREERQEQEEYQEWLRDLQRSSQGRNLATSTMQALRELNPEEIDVDLVARTVEYICQNKPCDGAILIFLPGWTDISKCNDVITKLPMYRNAPSQFRVIPLHSLMPTVNQREVFNRPPPGVRKIIIATNIAETSITIDDVVYVVDCGKIKMKNFDAENNIATLRAEWVSRANARQRRGRAGRVQPGECYHLYTSYHERKFADYQLPEMLRTRLEELCLQVKLLKLGLVEPFVQKAMQPPSMDALRHALYTLRKLNALDEHEDLTPLGYHLAKMPVDPHTGKMLLFGAIFSCLDPILTIAASLSFKDAFYIPMGKEREADGRRRELSRGSRSDHLMLAHAFSGWQNACHRGTDRQYCYQNFLSATTLRLLRDMRGQFSRLLHEMNFLPSADPSCSQANRHSRNEKLLKAVICAGLYPNVAKKIGKPSRNVNRPAKLMTNTDRKVCFHPKSVNDKETEFTSTWFVYHLKMKTAKVYLYDTTQVLAYPLLFFGGGIDIKESSLLVDEWISFRGVERVGKLICELRDELDKLLEYKITHPGPTDWQKNTKEGAVLSAIVELITGEEERVLTADDFNAAKRVRRERQERFWRGGQDGGSQ